MTPMQQLSLLPGQTVYRSPVRHHFSHGGVCADLSLPPYANHYDYTRT